MSSDKSSVTVAPNNIATELVIHIVTSNFLEYARRLNILRLPYSND
jgi:hypothetical protein